MKALVILDLIVTIAAFLGLAYYLRLSVDSLRERLERDLGLMAKEIATRLTEVNENVKTAAVHAADQFPVLSQQVATSREENYRQHQTMADVSVELHEEVLRTIRDQMSELNEQARQVKIHAQAIIDARLQLDANSQVSRAICSECKRPAWKFEIRDDKVVCGDCVTRPVPVVPVFKRRISHG